MLIVGALARNKLIIEFNIFQQERLDVLYAANLYAGGMQIKIQ